MSEHKDYDSWMEELRGKSEQLEVSLHEDKYHYHTYFMRGYCTDGVIDDIKKNAQEQQPARQEIS